MAIVFYHSFCNTIEVYVCLSWTYAAQKLHLISFINFQLVCVLWMNLHCIDNVCTFHFPRLPRFIFIDICWKESTWNTINQKASIQWNHALSNYYNLMIATTKKFVVTILLNYMKRIRCDATQYDAMNRQLNSNRITVDSLLKQIPIKCSKACTQKIHGISLKKKCHASECSMLIACLKLYWKKCPCGFITLKITTKCVRF